MTSQAPHQEGELYALQRLVLPAALHRSPTLSLRLSGPVGADLVFAPGGQLRLDTAYNIFALGKWRQHCALGDLRLILRGQGRFTLLVQGVTGTNRAPLMQSRTVTVEGETLVDLSDWIAGPAKILHLTLTALNDGRITDVIWASAQAPLRLPRLTLSITTFRRETEARAAIARFLAETEGQALAPLVALQVIDNGQTLDPVDTARLRVLPNRNLGGAGGFARGMAEAAAHGATHCLFMDDDAALDFTAITRIWTFLAHAVDPRTAIAGALMSAENPTELWENGANFRGRFQPFSRGRNLARPDDLFAAELTSLKPVKNFYGGFWCYAFALDHVTHAPFPFFVRGDDTSFCIANGFANVTLPGVISFQEVDFAEKESSQTLYLDLRSNLIHLVTLPDQSLRLWRLITLPARFFGRCLMQHQTDSLAALNLAVEDFLQGPGFVEAEPDLATRRAALAAARQVEVWRPLTALPAERRVIDPESPWQRRLMALTLNGLLLPGFARWGNRVVLLQKQRGTVRWCWGASQITYVTPDGSKAMQITQDKAAEWREGLRMARNLLRLIRAYPRLRRDWAKGYAKMTRPEWWAQFR